MRTEIESLNVTAVTQPPSTAQPTYQQLLGNQPLDNQRLRLIGSDWDNTLPERTRLYLHWQTADGYTTTIHDDVVTFDLPSWRGPWGITVKGSKISNDLAQQYVPFGQGITWHGELIDSLPAQKPGQQLTWLQQLRSSQPVLSDYALSVRLIGYEEDGFHWAWWDLDDSIPAMGAIPTLKWISGSNVRSPHFVTINKSAPSGQISGGAFTIYDAFNNRPLPILDERITSEFAWIPLGVRPLP
jgi:hypothetical protein